MPNYYIEAITSNRYGRQDGYLDRETAIAEAAVISLETELCLDVVDDTNNVIARVYDDGEISINKSKKARR